MSQNTARSGIADTATLSHNSSAATAGSAELWGWRETLVRLKAGRSWLLLLLAAAKPAPKQAPRGLSFSAALRC